MIGVRILAVRLRESNGNHLMRHLRSTVGVVALAAALFSVTAGVGATQPLLTERGLGEVRFGTDKTRAVTQLRSLLGKATSSGINTGCGSRFAEVAWHDFVAEFRGPRFMGYRYVRGGYPLRTASSPKPSSPGHVSPKLKTAAGITLMTTLRELRAHYKGLQHIGTNKWQSRNGLVFVDNAKHDPEPPSSRIIEIKFHTCGDF
jgi:hypothetical protein